MRLSAEKMIHFIDTDPPKFVIVNEHDGEEMEFTVREIEMLISGGFSAFASIIRENEPKNNG